MFPSIQIGPLALQTTPLILLLSFMLALDVSHRAASRLALNGDDVYNAGYAAAFAGVIGARAGFVIENWQAFQDDPASIFALSADGLSLMAGLGTGLIVAYILAQRKGLDNLRLLDALAPGLAVLAIGLSLGDLASGATYGSLSGLPWAMSVGGEPRHPVQIYHLLAAGVVALLVVRAVRPFDGARFALFVALTAAARLFLEAFHGDSATIGGLRTMQIASLGVLLAVLVLLRHWALAAARAKASEGQ